VPTSRPGHAGVRIVIGALAVVVATVAVSFVEGVSDVPNASSIVLVAVVRPLGSLSYLRFMESTRPIRLPAAVEASRERDQVEISAAIELVVRGAATRVVVAGLRDVESIAADALARAQAAGVRFNLTRAAATGAISVVVGPLAE
jgi:hypothetical protein